MKPSDQCSRCERYFDGDTPQTTPCCDVCNQCEVCGCACDEQEDFETWEKVAERFALAIEQCGIQQAASTMLADVIVAELRKLERGYEYAMTFHEMTHHKRPQ